VLRSEGILLAGFANPVLYLFGDGDEEGVDPLRAAHPIPYSDEKSLSAEQKDAYRNEGSPFEFGHTLADQIGGQLDAGFVLTAMYEDSHHVEDHPLNPYLKTFIATRALRQ
jgi:hypothetical protein